MVIAIVIAFIVWTGPMLSIPAAYFRRLRTMAAEADKGAYLPDLWRTLIGGLLKEWFDMIFLVRAIAPIV